MGALQAQISDQKRVTASKEVVAEVLKAHEDRWDWKKHDLNETMPAKAGGNQLIKFER